MTVSNVVKERQAWEGCSWYFFFLGQLNELRFTGLEEENNNEVFQGFEMLFLCFKPNMWIHYDVVAWVTAG